MDLDGDETMWVADRCQAPLPDTMRMRDDDFDLWDGELWVAKNEDVWNELWRKTLNRNERCMEQFDDIHSHESLAATHIRALYLHPESLT
jgi:hypothetical protein